MAGTASATGTDSRLGALRTLAEPNRLRIFDALREKERCVSDLVAGTGLAQPLVSHHLRALVRAGLARAGRRDGFTFYSVDVDGMASTLTALTALLDAATLPDRALPGGNLDCCR